MRILYLTNGFPFPLTSGYLRHYYLIQEIARSHAVTLLSIVGPAFRPEHGLALDPFTEQVFTFSSTRKGRSPLQKGVKRLKAAAGISPADDAIREMRDKVRQLLAGQNYDAILFSGKETFPAIQDLKGLPLIVDICDTTSTRVRGRMRYEHWSRLPLNLIDYAQVRRTEKKLIQHASHVLFATHRDREALLGSRPYPATIVPNGVDLDYWARGTRQRGQDTIVFTGGMHYPPNQDAAIFLIEGIFPLVRQSLPGARVLIVGRDPGPALVRAGQAPGVTVTGTVEDVRPYLEAGTVFAAPLRFGAGIQNKVLEALAMELPVVASSLAAGGLRTEDGRVPPIEVAESREEFARKIVQKLCEWPENPLPYPEGRRFVAENFSWAMSGKKITGIFESFQQNGKGRSNG